MSEYLRHRRVQDEEAARRIIQHNEFYNIKVTVALDRLFKRLDAITTISNRPVGVPCYASTCAHNVVGCKPHVKYL